MRSIRMIFLKSLSSIVLISYLLILSDVNGQSTGYSTAHFAEVDIDIFQIDYPVQLDRGVGDFSFHSYYAVSNDHRVNNRTFSELRGLYSRKDLYVQLIDELASQSELSPFYVVKNDFFNTVTSVNERIDALLFTIPALGVSNELYPIIEQILGSGLDKPIGASLDIAANVLDEINDASDLYHLSDAVEVLEATGIALSGYRLLEDAKQMAINFTVFMALDLELYRMRLEKIERLAELQDPAFWFAFDKVQKRLDLIDRSYWLRTYQFAIENMDELMALRDQAGLVALKAMKAKFGVAMSKFVPWIGASAFAQGQIIMAENHRRSLAYGTLAGTLYKELEGKDAHLQSYLGYIYLRERNMAFRNWTTTVFSFLNFRSWNEVLNEFQRGYDEYRYLWLNNFLDQFLSEGINIVEREKELNICDVWSVANSGGVEGTIDRWDISELPEGVMLDVRYDMKNIPDKLVIEYPENLVQLDTGWRGASRFDGPAYPGGVVGPGIGENMDVFRKRETDYFIVKVTGVDDGTYWEYQVRCRQVENQHEVTLRSPEQVGTRSDTVHEDLNTRHDVDILPSFDPRSRIYDSEVQEPQDDINEDESLGEVQEEDIIWIGGRDDDQYDSDLETSNRRSDLQKNKRARHFVSIDYSNMVRTNSSLFRNENLVSSSSGTAISLTGYLIDGFKSGRAGIMYISSSSSIVNDFDTRFSQEQFDYSHVSFFASYAPSFGLHETQNTHLIGYFDIGASAILANLQYQEYEEILDGNFIDIFETEVVIEDEWFPGFNLGLGLIYSYQNFGIHIGLMSEITIIEDLNTSIINLFPQIGLNIRRR